MRINDSLANKFRWINSGNSVIIFYDIHYDASIRTAAFISLVIQDLYRHEINSDKSYELFYYFINNITRLQILLCIEKIIYCSVWNFILKKINLKDTLGESIIRLGWHITDYFYLLLLFAQLYTYIIVPYTIGNFIISKIIENIHKRREIKYCSRNNQSQPGAPDHSGFTLLAPRFHKRNLPFLLRHKFTPFLTP